MVRLSNIVQQNNPISFANTAPLSPLPGDEWVNLSTGIKYTYFVDSDTSQWVQFDAAQIYSDGASGSSISIDSAAIANLIDSDYINARVTASTNGLSKALALIYGE